MELEKENLYTEEEYYAFDHNGLTEFDNGYIISMAPPSTLHQTVTGWLYRKIGNYLDGKNCKIFIAPFGVRLTLENGIRIVEPDISVICDKNKINEKGCEGPPDFIIEVVSPSNKMHDYATKVNWYQQAGIKEYWIVNPMNKEVLVYYFYKNDVKQYTFADNVSVSIWNGDFTIDFAQLDT